VIHFVLSAEAGAEEIPYVLKGRRPPTTGSEIGSGNYSAPPKAIVFGGAYDDAAIGIILNSVGETSIPLLKADQSIPMPAIGPEYGRIILERSQAKLAELEKERKFDGAESGGTYTY
jgi:hypothetical protein